MKKQDNNNNNDMVMYATHLIASSILNIFGASLASSVYTYQDLKDKKEE